LPCLSLGGYRNIAVNLCSDSPTCPARAVLLLSISVFSLLIPPPKAPWGETVSRSVAFFHVSPPTTACSHGFFVFVPTHQGVVPAAWRQLSFPCPSSSHSPWQTALAYLPDRDDLPPPPQVLLCDPMRIPFHPFCIVPRFLRVFRRLLLFLCLRRPPQFRKAASPPP